MVSRNSNERPAERGNGFYREGTLQIPRGPASWHHADLPFRLRTSGKKSPAPCPTLRTRGEKPFHGWEPYVWNEPPFSGGSNSPAALLRPDALHTPGPTWPQTPPDAQVSPNASAWSCARPQTGSGHAPAELEGWNVFGASSAVLRCRHLTIPRLSVDFIQDCRNLTFLRSHNQLPVVELKKAA